MWPDTWYQRVVVGGGYLLAKLRAIFFPRADFFPALIDCYPWPFCTAKDCTTHSTIRQCIWQHFFELFALLCTVFIFVNCLHICAHSTLHCTVLRFNAQHSPDLVPTVISTLVLALYSILFNFLSCKRLPLSLGFDWTYCLAVSMELVWVKLLCKIMNLTHLVFSQMIIKFLWAQL